MTDHDPFVSPKPKDKAPFYLADERDRPDDAAHVEKMRRTEQLHRAANIDDPTQRPWKKGQLPFYLEKPTPDTEPAAKGPPESRP